MKRHTLGGYCFLLLIALGLAYWASLPQKSNDDDRQSVFQIASDAIGSVEYRSDDLKVTIEKKGDRYWITYDRPEKKKADGTVEVAAMFDRFLASGRLKDLFNRLSPLEAVRVIKNPDAAALAGYGLQNSKKIFQVKKGGKVELDLLVGKQSYGSQNLFVLDQVSKNVWLIDGDTVFDVEKADLRLYERNIMTFNSDEIKTAEITLGQKTKVISKTKRDQQGALVWTDDKENAAPNLAYKSWFERFERLKVGIYAREEQVAALEKIPILFSVTVTTQIGSKETISIRKVTEGNEEVYWLYSDFLKSFASIPVSRVEQVAKDVKPVFAL